MIIQPNIEKQRKLQLKPIVASWIVIFVKKCGKLVAGRQAGRKTGNTAVQGEQVFARAEKAAITAKDRKEGDSKSASSR